MAISYKQQWMSLSWDYNAFPATIFDSPDRQFKSGGHLFALWAPGMQDGRIENDFNAYEPLSVEAGKGISLDASLTVGIGDSCLFFYCNSRPISYFCIHSC